jgi:N-acetyl sugar amidotransferase
LENDMREKLVSGVPGAAAAMDEAARRASVVAAKRRCARCLYDAETPAIEFDTQGVCNYCAMHDQFDTEYPTGAEGERRLRELAARIKDAGRGKKFDVIVGVSGGCDSSYLLYKTKELGLRPLAVHFDNTWDSKIAVENIHNVLRKLDVELFTYVVDNEEYNDIYRAFMLAGVPDIEAPTDIGLATTLYLAAEKFGIKYMFEGHSFRTEGVSPLGWLYMDGKYIESVVKRFGNYRSHRLKSFPNLWITRFLKYMLITRVKKVRPLYWIDYRKEDTKRFLSEEFGWQWYSGHHLENRFTAFYHSYFLPRRFGIDGRVLGYAALVRSDQMARDEGLRLLAEPPVCDPDIIEMVKKRLGFSDAEFERVMTQPRHSYREFTTYKPTFERLRPFFWLMYRLDLVPKSFYIKYTSKTNV